MLSRLFTSSANKSLSFKSLYQLFVQVKGTPNPNFATFFPQGKTVMEWGTKDIRSAKAAQISPLAEKLFMIAGINRVFLGKGFISVGKEGDKSWETIKPLVIEQITNFYTSNQPLLRPDVDQKKDEIPEEAKFQLSGTIEERIAEVIEHKIRPNIQGHGGDIQFDFFDKDTGVAYVTLQGSCVGCKSSQQTLKGNVERLL